MWATQCTLVEYEADPCSCYGGVARRQGVIDRTRAKAKALGADNLILDQGAYFFGSGVFYPTFHGAVSAKYFAKSDYDGHTFSFRDYTAAGSDGKGIGQWVDRIRKLDGTLPPAAVTNLNATAFQKHFNSSHVARYTITTTDSGHRIAILGLTDPEHLTQVRPIRFVYLFQD